MKRLWTLMFETINFTTQPWNLICFLKPNDLMLWIEKLKKFSVIGFADFYQFSQNNSFLGLQIDAGNVCSCAVGSSNLNFVWVFNLQHNIKSKWWQSNLIRKMIDRLLSRKTVSQFESSKYWHFLWNAQFICNTRERFQ